MFQEESENEHWPLFEWLDEDRLDSMVGRLFPRLLQKRLLGLEEGFVLGALEPPPDKSSYDVSNAAFGSRSMKKGEKGRLQSLGFPKGIVWFKRKARQEKRQPSCRKGRLLKRTFLRTINKATESITLETSPFYGGEVRWGN